MGIKTSASLDSLFDTIIKIYEEELINSLQERGEREVAFIRDREEIDSWYDHTSNLRSSIGYAIYKRGSKMLESSFRSLNGGSIGSDAGRKMIADLAGKFSSTYALVIVAGMNYASYVESCENKDVLASAELRCIKMMESDINKAMAKAAVRINRLAI